MEDRTRGPWTFWLWFRSWFQNCYTPTDKNVHGLLLSVRNRNVASKLLRNIKYEALRTRFLTEGIEARGEKTQRSKFKVTREHEVKQFLSRVQRCVHLPWPPGHFDLSASLIITTLEQ